MSHRSSIIESVTEFFLEKRQKAIQKERGALRPQILLSFATCFGAFLFGNILSWGGPSLKHLNELKNVSDNKISDFAWVTSCGPLAIALGIIIWGFLTRRIGPKKTLLCHAPLMLLSWFLMAYFDTYNVYLTAHIVAAFCSASYFYAGDAFLSETLHRKNLKSIYTLFKSSIILGIFSMNVMNAFFNRLWLCVICGNMTIFCFIITIPLAESPIYLMQKNETDAVKSLKYYLGKENIEPELNVVRNHVTFLNFGQLSHNHMLTAKVIIKAAFLIVGVQFFRISTGYYAFILDSTRMLSVANSLTNPYIDNIIFGCVLFISRFVGCFLNLYFDYGVKKPMLISLFLCSPVLLGLGLLHYCSIHMGFEPPNGTILLLLCLFAICYDIGMNICPEILIFEYMPYQLYEFFKKIMTMVQWAFICFLLMFYMHGKFYEHIYIDMWILSGLTAVGIIFVAVFLVDTKGKSLMTIQIELGGNPIGNRGSSRQRLANPFERTEEMNYLKSLVESHIRETQEPMPTVSTV